jgi:hypothetical protein
MAFGNCLSRVAAVFAVAVVCTGGEARADSLSCKGRIVSSGDSTYQVRAVCGAPDATQQRVQTRTIRRRVSVPCARGRCSAVVEDTVDVVIEQWTYDFGRRRFIQYLTFEDGSLVRVESGSYGYK